MLSFWIVKHFNIIEDVLASILASCVGFTPDPFSFKQMKKAFRDSIIMTVTTPAHTGFQIVLLQELLSFIACKLTALIRMHDHLFLWLATPDSHE